MRKPALLSAVVALSMVAMPVMAATPAANTVTGEASGPPAGHLPVNGVCAGGSVMKQGKCVHPKGQGMSTANWAEAGLGVGAVAGIAVAVASSGHKPASP